METVVLRCLLAFGAAMTPEVAHADEWQAIERVQAYAISGKSGPDLYASIGERGPKIGNDIRVIAHTNFKLTWTRKYETEGDACTLASVRPNLVITYTVPKPAEQLPTVTARRWQTFIAGVRAHERIHGDYIKDMVHKIEAATSGLSIPDDPKCQKIRIEMTKRLGGISDFRRKQDRDFDQLEMSKGGKIQQLILALVNE